MQLRKRFVQPDKNKVGSKVVLQEHTEFIQQDQVKPEEEIELLPSVPSRRLIYSNKKKNGGKMLVAYTVSLLAVVLVFGGSVWWMKSKLSMPVASTNVPIVSVPASDVKEIQEKPTQLLVPPTPIELKPVKQLQTPEHPPQVMKVKQQGLKPAYKQIMKHKVEVGETLYRISLKYYHSGKYSNFLAVHNRLRSPSELKSGTYIEVPYPPKTR